VTGQAYEQPLYVFFGRWVEAREFARRHGITESDVVLAHTHDAMRRIEGTTRQIVFIRSTSDAPLPEDVEKWRDAATRGRLQNETNGFGATEVDHV
jgi:hypothetical protein